MQFANTWRSVFLATAGVVVVLTLSEVPVRAQERPEEEHDEWQRAIVFGVGLGVTF